MINDDLFSERLSLPTMSAIKLRQRYGREVGLKLSALKPSRGT